MMRLFCSQVQYVSGGLKRMHVVSEVVLSPSTSWWRIWTSIVILQPMRPGIEQAIPWEEVRSR